MQSLMYNLQKSWNIAHKLYRLYYAAFFKYPQEIGQIKQLTYTTDLFLNNNIHLIQYLIQLTALILTHIISMTLRGKKTPRERNGTQPDRVREAGRVKGHHCVWTGAQLKIYLLSSSQT